MAVLQEQVSKFKNPFSDVVGNDEAPAGQWASTLIEVKDEFGVTRPSYENPSVMETLDQTTFLFGFRDLSGTPHRIATKSMRISGNEKSNLMDFLKRALGATPKYGWDYCELKGKKFLLTVAHEARRNGQGHFPIIAAICPLPAGLPPDYRGAPAAATPAAAPVAPSPSFAPQSGGYGGQAYAPAPVPAPVDDEPLPF